MGQLLCALIKGYFSASGRFRSDEIKSGGLLAYVGSNASATFLPTQVIRDDGQSYGLTMRALPCPTFEGCEPVAVQQGAGMVVTRGTDEQIEASVEFLKWITEPENNISFSVGSAICRSRTRRAIWTPSSRADCR